ncbi:MAG: hypothetical protein KAU17_11705 [Spirochaetales bacterium]|nr:hypothetical protein [Spirochaetales bacterium]
MKSVIKEYDTKIDSKNRFTIRGAKYGYYRVREYNDGHIELVPRVLVSPNTISRKALNMMDKAVENFKNGKVSEPIDLSKYSEEE